jgi:hypothetical protein
MKSIRRQLLLTSIAVAVAGWFSSAVAGSSDTAYVPHHNVLDANEIGMWISNNGTVAHNDTMPYRERAGFTYPQDSAFTLMYGAWLWLAADVEGDTIVAIADSRSEFAPGPFEHPPVDDSSIFRVYKITADDADSGSEDWTNWPGSWGAPTDSAGKPLVTGDQSVWTVFNDGDSLRHINRGGGTAPLGAEVQLYAYVYANSGLLNRMVFLEYTIINKSRHDWTDFRAAIMSDPDLGVSADDMGSTDSALSFVCCHSFGRDTELPPTFSGAVGVMMVQSPSSQDGGPISGSANVLANLYGSAYLEMTMNILAGKDPYGDDYVDPTTGSVTRYPYGGDPRTCTGWLDYGKADRRLVITSAPADVLSGDTTHLSVVFVASHGESNFEALVELFDLAEAACDFHPRRFSGLKVMKNVGDGSIHSVSFDPPEQMWFAGRDWGGSALDGGIGWAGELWGTSLSKSENVDVEIIFDPQGGQKAGRLTPDDSVYSLADYVTVPFACRRVADSTMVNVLVIDADLDGGWTPYRGCPDVLDLILVTQSAYDPGASPAYSDVLFPNDALDTDLMYVVSLETRPGYERHNIRIGQSLAISVVPEGEPAAADVLDFGDVIVGQEESMQLLLINEYSLGKRYEFVVDDSEHFTLQRRGSKVAGGDTCPLAVTFRPSDTTAVAATLTIVSVEYDRAVSQISLHGVGRPWPIPGDIYADGILDLIDITAYVRYLYWGYVPANRGVGLDLDGDGDATLADLVMLVDMILYSD